MVTRERKIGEDRSENEGRIRLRSRKKMKE